MEQWQHVLLTTETASLKQGDKVIGIMMGRGKGMGGGESGTSDAYQSQSLNVGKNWMYSIKKKFF